MNYDTKMGIADLMCYIRREFLEAKAKKDNVTIEYLNQALSVILEAAYEAKDRTLAVMADDFLAASGDYFMEVEFKSNIPTEEAIRKNLGS